MALFGRDAQASSGSFVRGGTAGKRRRKALLGTTALIGIGLALPAAAQTIASPTAGGTITASGGSPTVNNQTASGGSVAITNLTQSTVLTANGVTINDTTGNTSANALDIRGYTSGLNSTGFTLAGANNLTTTVSGGSALYVQTNANMGVGLTSSGSVFTGSYGINLNAPSGYISFDSTGYSQSFIGNGSAVAGINAISSVNASIQIGGSSISGFATGVNASNFYGTGFISTGGSINATSTGILLSATGGNNSVNSQSAITAVTGISSTAAGDATGATTIMTSGAGTINSSSANSGTGIHAVSAGRVAITVGAAIGNTSAFARGIEAQASASTGNAINVNANVTAGTAGIYTSTGGAFAITVANGATVQAAQGVYDQAGSTVVNNGSIVSSGTGVSLLAGGSFTNNGSLTGGISLNGTTAASVTLANGSTTAGNIVSNGSGTYATTITGALTGDYDASSGTATDTVTLAATGSISGAVWLGAGDDIFNWQGGTLGTTVSGGTGNNIFNADFGAGNSASLDATKFPTNFYLRDLKSGTLTLTGSTAASGNPWQIENGTTLNFATTAFNVAGGASYAANAYGGTVNVLAGATVTGLNNFAASFGTNAVTFSNAGTISVDGNIFLSNGARIDVTNSGTMTAASYSGVRFASGGGTLTNTGTITGGSFITSNLGAAVSATIASVTINNNGSGILQTSTGGPYTVLLGAGGGTITNQASAIIRQVAANRNAAIYSTGITTIANDGTISTAATGAFDAITVTNRLTLTNSGSITAAAASGVSFTGANSAVTNNGGTITGGSDTNFGYGVQSSGTATGTVTNSAGLITGGRGGVLVNSTSLTVDNSAVIRGTDAASYGIRQADGVVTVNNIGATSVIAGLTNGIIAPLYTITKVNNAGTIGTGTVSGGTFTAGGTADAINVYSSTITNSGTIDGAAGGIVASAFLALYNTGTITGRGNSDGVTVQTTATIVNGGTITGGGNAGIYARDGTITNAAAGHIIGASTAGVSLAGAATFVNYGSATSTGGVGVISGNLLVNVNLQAGSTTGNITLGTGNDTLSIFNGRGTAGAATVDSTSGITLQNAGTLAAASFGTVDLGTGTNTLALLGTGDGTAANGAAGTYNLGSIATASILTKGDTGTWTLTGAASGGLTTGVINANGGTLVFSGTGLTGGIYLRSGVIRATTTTAFGTGTIHAIDPTIQFGATGTYANAISLEVVAPASSDPTILSADAGVTATLTGLISRGAGDATQYVTIGGNGTIVLANTGNSWAGVTAINAGATLQGATNTISGSSFANAGTLAFSQNFDGSFTGNISGAGAVQINVPSQILTLNGANTYSGATNVVAGTLSVGGGMAIGDTSAVSVASGATLSLASGETIGSLAGAGTTNLLANRLTVGGDNASTTFSGAIIDTTPVAYIGSWVVSDGPAWSTNPPTYTAQQAAALLFGGNASDYRTSTVGTSTATINDLAWYNTYGASPSDYVQASATYRVDSGTAGYNFQGDTSAYVQDHTGNPHTNYAFTGGLHLGGGLTKTGTGTLTLTGINTYTGLTSILGGTLAISGGSAISDAGSVNVGAGATFSVLSSETIASLNGAGSTMLSSSNLTLANAAGTYSGTISGTGALALTGGALTLGGAATQSGGVTMATGTSLTLSSTGSINAASANGITNSAGTITVVNSGAVAGGTGNSIFASAGTITNNVGGTLSGLILFNGTGASSVTNSGTTAAIGATGGGTLTITNNVGGLVARTFAGSAIDLTNSALSLTNAGDIVGYSWGVVGRNAADSITNSGRILTGTLASGYGSAATVFGGEAISLNGGGGTVLNQTGGLISGGSYGILANGGASITNQVNAFIRGGAAGIAIAGTTTINNAGSITSTGNYAIVSSGTGTITNSGIISGTLGGINLGNTAGTMTVNLLQSSTTGAIVTANNGTHAVTIAGSLDGYNASSGSGIDTLTLAATGSIAGTVQLGAGNDGFTWRGGSFTSIDAGAGTDSFASDLGTGVSRSLSLASLTNFESHTNQTGNLTLTGSRDGGIGWAVSGGTLTLSGSLNNTNGSATTLNGTGTQLTVNSGATLSSANGQAVASSTAGTSLVNNGTITGVGNAINATASFTLTNAGTINGNVALGTGADSVTLNGGAVNGAINLGGGNDTLNWNGGTFTSADGGAGTDVFNVNTGIASTLSVANITGFETQNLQSSSLTLVGTQSGQAGWTLGAGTTLNIGTGGFANWTTTGTAATLNSSNATINVNWNSTVGGETVTIAGNASGIAATVNNDGTINAGSAGAISLQGASGQVNNTGTITALAPADNYALITLAGPNSSLVNSGTITGVTYVTANINAAVNLTSFNGIVDNQDGGEITGQAGIYMGGTNAQITNAGTITATIGNGVTLSQGGRLINSGTISGGSVAVSGWGVLVGSGAATIENSGTINGGSAGAIGLNSASAISVNLQAGSTVNGDIVSTGGGSRDVYISGALNGSYVSIGAGIDNLVLTDGGSITSADLGDGDDTFTYYGGTIAGMIDGGAGNDTLFADFGSGNSGTVSLTNFTNFEGIGLLSGNLTLSGPSTSPGTVIYAGNGAPSGEITFDGTSNITGDIYINGGSIRAESDGAFGSGTIHMIDPAATFGASGTFANNISLEVATPSASNPSTLIADAGVIANLTGAITTGTGAGVDLNQDLVIGGQGTVVLSNTANSWTGTTTINLGATLQGTGGTISGSGIVTNGTLAYVQPASGTISQDISGTGVVTVSGLGGGQALTYAGAASNDQGFQVLDGSTLINAGSITTSTSNAVTLAGGGTFLNQGSITGAISSSGAADALVSNSGAISGVVYNGGTGLLTVSNQAGGTIDGGSSAAFIGNGAIHLINDGNVSGGYAGLYLNNAATVIDNGGTIIGGTFDIGGYTLNAGSTGVTLLAGGTVNNQAGGTIAGDGVGIASNGALTLTNAVGGTITGGVGVNVTSGSANITNAGAIFSSGTDYAIGLQGGGTIVNSGTIAGGTNGTAIVSTGTLGLTNQAGATLTGLIQSDGATTINLQAGSTTNGAIQLFGNADSTVSIAGSYAGNVNLGGGNDTLILFSDATIGAGSGFNGSGGTDALVLAGTSNATLDVTNVANFDSRTMEGTGVWTLTGFDSSSNNWAIDSGTVLASGGSAIGDTSTVTISAAGTLGLANNETIGALAGAGNVALGGNTLALSGTGSFDGTIAGTGGVSVLSGASLTLNGASSYSGNTVVGGTLALGASDVLADGSSLVVQTGGVLNLGANSDTVAAATLAGTVNGTGTLSATGTTFLNGAVINANLAGSGTLLNGGGTSVLNGTAAQTSVVVSAGTLSLGAANRLADTATVTIVSGATLNLGAFNDTVGGVALSGTLAGTGTLTAAEYDLTGATVNANLGTGTLIQLGGISTLNGTAAAGTVSINTGSLVLGASNRLADTAAVSIASGAVLNLGAFNDTVGTAAIGGYLNGTGTLTANIVQLDTAVVNANVAGTLVQHSGTSVLNGTATSANVAIDGGFLILGASDRISDNATVTIASGAVLNVGAFNDTVGIVAIGGQLTGTGTLTASEYQLNGAAVYANLGAGNLYQLGGTSYLGGTSAAANVSVQAGTLTLQAANRLADTAAVSVTSGATLNLGSFSDTVGTAAIAGMLAGSGTLTASLIQLDGATVNANLGAGTLTNASGTSVLNGTSAATLVAVNGGTLSLGAADRLTDGATVTVASGATLNLGANSDTVAALGLNGTLAGTGTLTAAQVQLNGATVNANLGTGTLVNVGGTSMLTGSSAASTVLVSAGTLRLGASERLANTAILGINSGATFDLAGYTETVASLVNGTGGGGTLALGAGKLVVSGNADAGFSGNISGSGVFEKQGTGTLTLSGTLAMTGRIDVTAGTLAYAATSAGSMRLQGGTLIGGGVLSGNLTIASGSFSPGGLGTGLLGTTINPIGSFTVGSLNVSGGSLLFDFGGTSLNFASDSIKVTGAATLTGGTVSVNALSSAASDYRFNQLYTIVQAGTLTGTFGNGSTFSTVTSNPNLKWRLRYDLVANSVVLQVQKNMEFTDGVSTGDVNTLAVANALGNSTTGNASDDWANTLNSITALTAGQRVAAFKSFSGEALADLSTTTIAANNLFTGLLRQRVGDGDDALVGGGFGDTSLAQVRSTTTVGNTFASRLASADAPETGGNGGGIWGQAYGGYQHLLGTSTTAGLETTTAGVAMGAEVKHDGFTAGVAGGVAQIDGDVNSRNSTLSGTQYQLGGYVSYDSGSVFVSGSGSWYSGEFDSKRTLGIGGLATGDIHSDGYSFGATAGFRAELGGGLKAAVIASATQVHDSRDGFTENAAGGLGLQMASANRDLFTATGEIRLGAKVKTGSGTAMPWVSAGVRYNAGDLDALGNMRFSGAPIGTGAFTIDGARTAPVLGTLGVGIDARASKNVRLGVALEGAAGQNTREGKASIRIKIGF